MSGSEDEAFASAEEGEEEKKSAKSGKSSKDGAQGKGAGAAAAGKSADTSSGKQKGKQQQRKKKSKGQPKSVKEEKEQAAEKKPTEDTKSEAQASSSSEAASSATASPDSASVSQKEVTATVSTPAKDSSKDTPIKDKQNLGSSNAESKAETAVSAEKTAEKTESETVTKSAGDVRKDLKSSTQQEDSSNPGAQVIPRDAGDATGAAGGEQQPQGKEDGGEGGKGGGWSWGWGSSILSAATNSLETFSSQVGEGLTTIIDTVESSLGVPDPEEMVRAESAVEPGTEPNGAETVTAQPKEKAAAEEQLSASDSKKQEAETASGTKANEEAKEEKTGEAKAEEGGSWLSGWGVTNITSVGKSLVNKGQTLMNTGFEKAENIAAGGLDILETIGKKTYTTLTEHDPGLRRAREFLHLREEKPSLSTLLKEAREQSEEQAKKEQEFEEARKCNFGALFEDNQGLAHLEALEMLSNRSERKVQSLLSAMADSDVDAVRPNLMEIKKTFQQAMEGDDKEPEAASEHDFNKLVTDNLTELHLGTAPDKLNKVQETVRQWIADFYTQEDHSGISSAKEVQQRAVQSLADVTSKAVEQFHKAGELVLLQKDDEKTYTHRAESLAKLAHVLVTEVDILATKFSQCLNKIAEEKDSADEVNPMVTNVYLEASNASGYIQDAFQLLLPVIQHAALQSALSQAL